MQTLPLRALFASGVIALLGSVWYYLFTVTWPALAVILVVAVAVSSVVPLVPQQPFSTAPRHAAIPVLAFITLVALGGWWNAVLHVTITDAVRSPWLMLSPVALLALGVVLIATTLLLARGAIKSGVTLFCVTLFSALAMGAVAYPLGMGFDPFLHRATVAHIAEFGTITPKPLYYIGQYSLELVLTVLGHIPLLALDRFFLPVFAVLAIATSMWYGLGAVLRAHPVAFCTALLLPLGAFIATTPQGIAYVFALCAVLCTFAPWENTAWYRALFVPTLLAGAALCTHPFAGIPAVLYVGAWAVISKKRKVKSEKSQKRGELIIYCCAAVAASAAIPLLFAVEAAKSGLALNFHIANFFSLARWQSLALSGFFSNHFNAWYDGLYLVVDNLLTLTIVLGVLGYVIVKKTAAHATKHAALLALIFAGGMFVNFLLLSIGFDFDFLISYERSDYAVRALTLTQLLLFPCVVYVIAHIDGVLTTRPRALRLTFIVILAVIGTANIYGAYPRHDNYARSAGFNVSRADIDAVHAIAADAKDANYIVLANQATSAAAIAEYGFSTYYHTDIFYYPIPTGGPLYTTFLSMVNDAPTRATMLAAMDVATDPDAGRPVDLAYFAVSNYWWKSDIIIENAKREADDWFAVDDGSVTVFIFRR